MRSRLGRLGFGALVYLALGTAWFYGLVDQGRVDPGSDWRTWSVLAAVLLVHVVFGWVMREWAAVLLPLVLIPLLVPAGYPVSQYGEPLPLWLAQIIYSIFEIPAVAAGVALRTLFDGWRRTPWPSR